ncbi:hypothetical protein Peur_009335 [Populus x canadensis]
MAPFDGKKCPVDNFLWDEQNMRLCSLCNSIARNYIAVDQPRRKHTVKVHVSTENVASNGTSAIQQEEARRAKFSRMSRCSLFRDLLSIMGVCCRLDH